MRPAWRRNSVTRNKPLIYSNRYLVVGGASATGWNTIQTTIFCAMIRDSSGCWRSSNNQAVVYSLDVSATRTMRPETASAEAPAVPLTIEGYAVLHQMF